jgi:transcriptional regulator with XRE-family HTH domain
MATRSSILDPRYVEMVARLRAARRRLGMSQRQLAARIRRPQSYVSKVETCERRLDVLETLELCQALGLSLDDVIPEGLRTSEHRVRHRREAG